MRQIIAVTALAIALSASAPAAAQYGGSPDAQVDGDYVPIGDGQAYADGQVYADEYGKPAYGEGGPDEGYGGKSEWAGDPGYAEAYPDGGYADQGYGDPGYGGQDYPAQQPPGGYEGETWQGSDGRAYCRRSDGTTGLIVGAGAGALVGRGIDSRGDRGAGTIIGAIFGALLGSAVERSASCR